MCIWVRRRESKRAHIREREWSSRGAEAEGKGDAGSPLSREPRVGLDARTPGLRPDLKADASQTEPLKRPALTSYEENIKTRAFKDSDTYFPHTHC